MAVARGGENSGDRPEPGVAEAPAWALQRDDVGEDSTRCRVWGRNEARQGEQKEPEPVREAFVRIININSIVPNRIMSRTLMNPS